MVGTVEEEVVLGYYLGGVLGREMRCVGVVFDVGIESIKKFSVPI